MKVLILSHMYPSTFSGVYGLFVQEQVKALIAKGVEVRVVSPVPWAPFPLNGLSRKWKRYSQVPTRTIWEEAQVWYPRYVAFPRGWFFASSGTRMYNGIGGAIKDIYREFPFDLIHAHVALPDGYAGALLAQEYRKPLVVTIHGQDLQSTALRGEQYKESLRRVFAVAVRIIVVSRKLKRLAKQQFGIDEKVIVIHNGVAPKKILQNSLSLARGNRIVLSVSNLIHTKGVDLNVRAMSRLMARYPDLRYLIVGGGPLEKSLRNLSRELEINSAIKFVGRVSHERVMEYMAGCDIFSLPSWQEGFGIVYIEAMAHGKPVIACQGEGPEDFIEHGKTGMLVKPRDVDSLVEALDFLLSHPEEAAAMGARARKLVLENFTWEKNAEKIIDVYEEVLRAR